MDHSDRGALHFGNSRGTESIMCAKPAEFRHSLGVSLLKGGYNLSLHVGTSLAFYKGQKGLSLENSEKRLKGVPGARGPGAEKTRKRVENNYFSSYFRVFGSFSTLFRVFFGPGAGNPFSEFFRSFLGRAFLTPAKGKRCPNLHVPSAVPTPPPLNPYSPL